MRAANVAHERAWRPAVNLSAPLGSEPRRVAAELRERVVVPSVRVELGGHELAEGPVVLDERVPGHAVVQVVLEVERDVEGHEERTPRKERGARAEVGIS